MPIYFDNKGLDYIQISSILHEDEIISKLPQILRNEEVPSVVYSLGNTIRNKIFNYKETVNAIDLNDTEGYGTGIVRCDCHESEFVNEHHGHVVTGDLRIIRNQKLRKLISKGPNFREPKTINWKRCRDKIVEGLTKCACKMALDKKIREDELLPWKNLILEKVDSKITALKNKVKPKKSNPILKQPDVMQYLNELHKKYVLVPIDKAANNVAIVCKKHYVDLILNEIGATGTGNDAYVRSDKELDEVVSANVEYSERLRLPVDEKDLDLPVMYWTPKMHKIPSACRFIIASKHCSTKPVSKSLSAVFKRIYGQVEKFHKNAKFLSNYNKFWILLNSDPIIARLKSINQKKRAKSIATYDFSTLYTKLPHNKLIDRLSKVIDLVYKGGDKKFIRVLNNGHTVWSRTKKGVGVCFSKGVLKTALSHLIQNCYFTVGNIGMRQAIGIPMGIDPAPFWANLFLYSYEEEYISRLIPLDPGKARHFHSTYRFIDDLCALNDGGEFGKVFKDIYPEELELKLEHSGQYASFLNLDITIEDGIFNYKLYDKRDAFPFHIVRMPHINSNIPRGIFYSALVGEFLRIARSTLQLRHFLPKAKKPVSKNEKTRCTNSSVTTLH